MTLELDPKQSTWFIPQLGMPHFVHWHAGASFLQAVIPPHARVPELLRLYPRDLQLLVNAPCVQKVAYLTICNFNTVYKLSNGHNGITSIDSDLHQGCYHQLWGSSNSSYAGRIDALESVFQDEFLAVNLRQQVRLG
jgi:hypothetical protein